jgi:hypothetical protein
MLVEHSASMKELEDYVWFPAELRNFQTAFIGELVCRLKTYAVFEKYLTSQHNCTQAMHDLCSGSGEPAISIFKQSACFESLTLSDKFPHPLYSNDHHIQYQKKTCDVLNMTFKKGTCYTIFNALHHFSDSAKIEVAQSIRRAGASAYFVEILTPSPLCLLKVAMVTTIGPFLLCPFMRAFSFRRFFLTYVFPLNVICTAYDGIVSVFKSRPLKHYQKLFSDTTDVSVFGLKNCMGNLIVIKILPEG